jgi:hypothetical protein
MYARMGQSVHGLLRRGDIHGMHASGGTHSRLGTQMRHWIEAALKVLQRHRVRVARHQIRRALCPELSRKLRKTIGGRVST